MKVLAYCPTPLDGTAYWRAASPLAQLRRMASDFQFTIVDKVHTNLILEHDVLLLQRPFLDEHLVAMQTAHVLGRKVWCDWDDDILNVPINNGRVFTYQREKFKQNVRLLAQAADAVTVTCEHLAKVFRAAGCKAPFIVPNALDPTLELQPPDSDKLPVRRVVWRGGDSHNQDLLEMGKAFTSVAQELEGEVLWHFVGFNPYWLLGGFPAQSAIVHGWIGDVVTYFRFISNLRPSIMAVPLVDDAFNRCKSNISVIEAAWMGAVPVVPKWLEGCDLPGAVTYKDNADFERALRDAACMPSKELQQRRDAIRKSVMDGYGLDKINLLRALVLKRLTGRSTLGGEEEALHAPEAPVPVEEPQRSAAPAQ